MLSILAPAKTMDLAPTARDLPTSPPALLDQSQTLVDLLRKKSTIELSKLMKINADLAQLNADRYRAFRTPFTEDNSKPAALTFAGVVFQGLDAPTMTDADLRYAQDHLAILSGLYGVLRPLDRMQPYRLEMGTRLKTPRGNNLYDFWGRRITAVLNQLTEGHADRTIINLASQEYLKSVQTADLKGGMITPVFKDRKGDALRVVAVYAKRARGEMARWILQHRLEEPARLKDFDGMGYRYQADGSTRTAWLFVR